VSHGTGFEPYLDPRDREHAAALPSDERAAVVSTVTRFRRPDSLRVGDPLPDLELRRLEDGSRVRLGALADGRPLVLVFGSFT
jgi:hypothetical protein